MAPGRLARLNLLTPAASDQVPWFAPDQIFTVAAEERVTTAKRLSSVYAQFVGFPHEGEVGVAFFEWGRVQSQRLSLTLGYEPVLNAGA